MSNTANDLARDVGLELGIIDSVSDLGADELEDLTNISRRAHADLRAKKACSWDENDIPDEAYEALKRYIACLAAKTFGKVVRDEPMSEYQTRQARFREVKAVAALPYAGNQVKATYY